MKAIVQDRYGSADVLEFREVDKPVPEDEEILVRAHAAGLDAGVWHLMTGLPYLVRVMGFGLRAPKVRVRGWDVAGTVEATGRDVTEFAPGDEVFGCADGTFAEYCRGPAAQFAHKPGGVDFTAAAAVPTSAITALRCLRDVAGVRRGQHVLVLGAGGGVGTFAVQLAKAWDAEVTGVCGTDKTDLVHSLGADRVVDYTREDVTAAARRYDVVLDTAGNRPLSHLRRILAPRGTLVIVGGEKGGRWTGGVGRTMRAQLLSPFTRQRLRGPFVRQRPGDLDDLCEYLEAGTLKPVVGQTYSLAEAAKALREWEKGHTRGKTVLVV